MNALDTYTKWLPATLLSGSSGYAKYSERLLTGDFDSESGYRRDNWNLARQLHVQQIPNHRAVAYLLAEHAAGLFADAVVLKLLLDKQLLPHRTITQSVTENILDLKPWFTFEMLSFDAIAEYGKNFDDTVFAEVAPSIDVGLAELARAETKPTLPTIENLHDLILHTGAMATLCYIAYATEHSQLELPLPLDAA